METRKCSKCGVTKELDKFSGNYCYCKSCANERVKARYWKNVEISRSQEREKLRNDREFYRAKSRAWREKKKGEGPEYFLWKSCKTRAARNKLAFDIEVSDINVPPVCPVLGITLVPFGGKGMRDDCPSVDRIDNTKGYIKGNICVISWRANLLKRDASLEELEKITDYVRQKLT